MLIPTGRVNEEAMRIVTVCSEGISLKKVDFSGLDQIKLNKIQNIINNTPRKILDGDSARERIDKEFNGLVEMIEKIINH